MSENLAGIILWTDNLLRLRSFYEETLGLHPHSVREDFIAYSWDLGTTVIRFSIGLHSEVLGRTKDPLRVMINFNVRNIEDRVSKMKKAGTKFIRNPELEHWGGIVATFEDPDGNVVQLLQQAETELEDS